MMSSSERDSRMERLFARIAVLQTLMTGFALVLSVLALYAALTEADAVRKQQQASVWPSLDLVRSYTGTPGDESIALHLLNSGIGPAKVRNVTVEVDHARMNHWSEVATVLSGDTGVRISNTTVSGRVLAAGGSHLLFGAGMPDVSTATVERIRDGIDSGRFSLEICYCSVFDSCWEVRFRGGEANPVGQCLDQPEGVSF